MAIITRADKGSALTYNEMDANFEAIAPRDSATGSVQIPSGTTSERTATPQTGQLRFNTTANAFEGYVAGNWVSLIAGNAGEINQNAFSEFIVSGQNNVTADTKTDSVTLVAGTNISITTDAVNDSITFTNTFTQDFAFASLTGTPTTIAGYGITDAFDGAYSSLTGAPTNISAFTNDSGYLTSFTETNDLSSAVTWANVPDANITQTSVTQHQAALSITESQISDLGAYLTAETNDLSSTVTWANVPNANITESSVTQHQAALSITESQISDFGTYLTSETTTTLISDSVNQRLRYTDETGTVNDINLSWAVDDTNLARITSGSVAADTGIATFTRDDASSFTVDFSALFDDTNLARITSASFNTSNGVLTLTRGGDATTVTVDLDGRYLTGYTETDPVVGAINGLVKSDGSGNISAAVAGTDYSTFDGTFGALTGTPTTVAGYGITDAFDGAFSSLSGTPTTVAGYGITDAFDGAYSSLTGTPTLYSDSAVDTHLNTSTATNNQILSWTGSDYDWIAQPSGGISNVVEDTTPELGGDLDSGGNKILTNEIKNRSGNDNVYIVGQSNDTLARFVDNGAVYLYHNGFEKLRTDATSGVVCSNGLFVGGNATIGNNSASSILTFTGRVRGQTPFRFQGGQSPYTYTSTLQIPPSMTASNTVDWPINVSGTLLTDASILDPLSGTATSGQVLSYNGSALDWVDPPGAPSIIFTRTVGNPNEYGFGSGDDFGYSVDICGDYAVVGAWNGEGSTDGNTDGGGVIYIYDARNGEKLHQIDNPRANTFDRFGQSVAISGNYVVAGAPASEDGANTFSGQVHVFDARSGSLIRSITNPNASGTTASDYFGVDVAISGDLMVSGADHEDGVTGTNAGVVYVHRVSTGELLHTLNNPNNDGTGVNDYFGRQVDICGNFIVVQANETGNSGGTTLVGALYVFWAPTGSYLYTITNPGGAVQDYFGSYGVAVSDHYIVAAASKEDNGATDTGIAYIFDVKDGTLLTTINSPRTVNPGGFGVGAFCEFGRGGVSISGNYVAIGSEISYDESGNSGVGAVDIFRLSDGEHLLAKFNPGYNPSNTNDRFGYALGLSGRRLVVSTYDDDSTFPTVTGGVTHFFDLKELESVTYTGEEIASFSQLMPFVNMTTTERNAINNPLRGMVIYNTSTNTLNVYNGSSWVNT